MPRCSSNDVGLGKGRVEGECKTGNHVTITRSPIRRIGSKAQLIQKYKLWEFFPRFYYEKKHDADGKDISRKHVYLEVFSGSCVMFFNLDPPPLFAYINDIDEEIYNFWTVLRDDYEGFTKVLQFTFCGQSWLDDFGAKRDKVSRALAFYIRNRTGSICTTPVEFFKDFSTWKEKMDRSRLQIWNLDYTAVMDRVNKMRIDEGTNCTEFVIYEDPPYFGSENHYRKGKDFNVNDHYNLAKLNHQTNHHVILSYNDHDIVRSLYNDWYLIELQDKKNLLAGDTRELLLSNRPLVRHARDDKIQSKVI